MLLSHYYFTIIKDDHIAAVQVSLYMYTIESYITSDGDGAHQHAIVGCTYYPEALQGVTP